MRTTTQRGVHRVRAALALLALLTSFLVVGASSAGATPQGSSPGSELPVCGESASGVGGFAPPSDCPPPPPPPPPPAEAAGAPSVAVREACVAGRGTLTVTLGNTATAEAQGVVFVVTDPESATPSTHNVVAGASTDVTFAGLADGSYVVGVLADGVDVSPAPIVVNCAGVAHVGDPAPSCNRDGGAVELTLGNLAGDGARQVTYRVTHPVTKVVTEYKVGPGATQVVAFTGLDPGTYSFLVSADGIVQTVRDVVVACEIPFAAIGTLACAAGGIDVNFENSGESPTTEALLKNGVLLTTVEVPARGSEIALVPMTEGERATITVKSGDLTLAEKTVTDNCASAGVITPTDPTPPPPADAQVLGATQTRTASGTLPRTGAGSGRLGLAGVILVLAGAGLVMTSRRRLAARSA